MTPKEAIEIVAERAIWVATREIQWEDYPDIGQHDWQRVLDEIDLRMDGTKSLDSFPAAYELLASRATDEVSP